LWSYFSASFPVDKTNYTFRDIIFQEKRTERGTGTFSSQKGVMMARSCPSEPHSGGWGGIFGEAGLGLALKVSSNNKKVPVPFSS